MEKRRPRIQGFSLVEMLLVMGILVVFGAFGAGGFLGFRETALVKENVEMIKQDIQLAQQKAMLLERDTSDNWLYGIGLDFSTITTASEDANYKMFRWCSPVGDFGSPITRSKVPGWDETQPIGTPISEVLGISDIYAATLPPLPPVDPIDPPILDDTETCFSRYITYCDTDPSAAQSCYSTCASYCASCGYSTSCPYCRCIPSSYACGSITPPLEEEVIPFKNGYIPVEGTEPTYTESCTLGTTSFVEITGEAQNKFTGMGEIQLLGGTSPVQYVVFEAVTGKAFLYDSEGRPVNYSTDGDFDGSAVLDIVITRKRSSKFDVISIYPTSGTIVHHVYTNDDLANASDSNTIEVDGKSYRRFGVWDDINSYRD